MATKAYTGVDGSFKFAAADQVRVTAWTVEGSTNVLDKSEVGDFAVTNLVGLKSYSGSATIVYYSNDAGITAIADKIFVKGSGSVTGQAEFIWGSRTIKFEAIVSSFTISASAGEIVTAEISFVATGDLESVNLTA